jgi:hypothetical protein
MNQYVQIADSPALRPASVTLECWLNASNTSGNLISKPVGAGSSDSYVIWLESGDLNGAAGNSSGQEILSHAFTPVPGVWYHAAYTFDNDTQTQTIYLNGVPVALGPADLSLGYDSHPVLIGTEFDYNSPVLPFTGEIDEVSIYDRALTAEEIESIYLSGSAGKCANSLPHVVMPQMGAGTNPQAQLVMPQAGANFSFGIQTISGQSYTVLMSTNLMSTNWSFYTNITGNGSLFQFATPVANSSQRFFRVREP